MKKRVNGGWETHEKHHRGFALTSRKPHPEDPQTTNDVRFIEVTGQAVVGEEMPSQHTNTRRRSDSRTIIGCTLCSIVSRLLKFIWYKIQYA